MDKLWMASMRIACKTFQYADIASQWAGMHASGGFWWDLTLRRSFTRQGSFVIKKGNR